MRGSPSLQHPLSISLAHLANDKDVLLGMHMYRGTGKHLVQFVAKTTSDVTDRSRVEQIKRATLLLIKRGALRKMDPKY